MAQYINFQPKDYFNAKLYTGNNTSTNAITNLGFEPSLVWIKARNYGDSHRIYDAVRGANYHLSSNSTGAQGSLYNLSFASDGFTIGSSDPSVNGNYNYVSWNWKANGAGVSNTDGSITSTVSASTTSGFSIVQYTGNGSTGTVGTGLSNTPRFIIVKQISGSANDWGIYYNPAHHINGQQGRAMAFNTSGFSSSNDFWNNTGATSSVFSLGSSGRCNQSGQTYIAYCFADVTGYQQFHGWYANANTNAPFLYCGFKPAFFLMFNINNSGRYMIADNKRNTFNEIDKKLSPHNSNAEVTSADIACDFVSTGIKIRGGSTSDINYAQYNMMYGLAIAEHPLVSSNNIPCTAK